MTKQAVLPSPYTWSVAAFLLLVFVNATAEDWCHLTNQYSHHKAQQLQLANQSLICDAKPTFKALPPATTLYPKERLLVVRGNKVEIQNLPVKVLLQAHGYSLVLKNTQAELKSDPHLSYIAVDDFQPIIKATTPPSKSSQSQIQTLVDQVDSASWLADIVTLSTWSRQTGSTGNASAANWIENQFSQFNLQTSQVTFNVGSSISNNIMGIQTGLTRPDDWYVVGAHMDSISGNDGNPEAPGAVDNASGCAGVIEMARIASQYSFAGSIIFICYSGEEQGLFGSEFHADTLINNGDDDKIKAALTMDMIGYIHNTQHELLVESSGNYQWLMNTLVQNAATYAPDLTVFTSTNYFGSDHVSYIDNGMPAVLSIDDDYALYPDYHRSTDLPENINTNQGEYIIKTNLATLAEVAEVLGTDDLIYRNGFEQSVK